MSFDTFTDFAEAARPYLDQCVRFCAAHNLTDNVIVDHICFKCSGKGEYERIRHVLEQSPPSKYFYQVHLAARRVAYIGLTAGLPIGVRTVDCVEMADKKPHEPEVLGFHHVEIYSSAGSYVELVQRLESSGQTVSLRRRPHHSTHDITLPTGFIIRITDQPLIKKISKELLA